MGTSPGSHHLTDERWLKEHGQEILPYVLQVVDPPDSEVKKLVNVGLIKVGADRLREHTKLTIRFSCDSWERNSMRISDVAGTSTALAELYASLIAANEPFGLDLEMPNTSISVGSIDHMVAGIGVLLHGSVLLIEVLPIAALHVAIPPLTIVAAVMIIGGGTASMIHESRKSKKSKEPATQSKDKIDQRTPDEAQTKANDVPTTTVETPSEGRKPQSEASREIELPIRPERDSFMEEQIQTSSGYLKMQDIKIIASQLNLGLAYSVHLLNRALPTAVGIQKAMPNVQIAIIPTA